MFLLLQMFLLQMFLLQMLQLLQMFLLHMFLLLQMFLLMLTCERLTVAFLKLTSAKANPVAQFSIFVLSPSKVGLHLQLSPLRLSS